MRGTLDNVVRMGFIFQQELAPKLIFPSDIAATEDGSECNPWWKKVLIELFSCQHKKNLCVPAFAPLLYLCFEEI